MKKKMLYLTPVAEIVELGLDCLVCASETGGSNEPIYVEDIGDGGFQQV